MVRYSEGLLYIYLDDIIIASTDTKSHLDIIKLVLQRLQESGLKVKLTKCEFLKKKISFLGHDVDGTGLHTSDDKVKAVANFPQPKSVENVWSFLGLAGYYRPFINNFTAIANSLTLLLKKETPFHWDEAQERSFQNLKEGLTNAPVLAFPEYKQPFLLCTNASTPPIPQFYSR